MKITLSLLSILLSLSLSAQNDMLILKSSGKVIIGDTTQISTPGNYNLYVQNGILTERVKVALKSEMDWSDHAFSKTPTLESVEASIKHNKHLPHMPSAKELTQNGYEVVEMDAKLLAQIEWLWQHMIRMKKENQLLKEELEKLKRLDSINPNK